MLGTDNVFVRVAIAVREHHDPKQLKEERVYLIYIFYISCATVCREMPRKEFKHGRNQEPGADAEAMEPCY